MKKLRTLLRLNHADRPSRIVASADGQLIVSAGDTIYFWDTRPKAKSPRLTIQDRDVGAHQPVSVLDVSPDGKCLCTGAADLTTKVYSAESGERLTRLSKLRPDYFNSGDQVGFLAEGRILVTVMGRKAEVFRVGDWEQLHELRGHTSKISVVDFLPGSSLLVSAAGKYVKLWDAEAGTELLTLPAFPRMLGDLALALDASLLAAATEGGEVSLWELPDGIHRLTYSRHDSQVFGLAMSPDKSLVASSGMSDSLHLWRATDGSLVAEHSFECSEAMAFSPDGKYLAVTAEDDAWLLETTAGAKVASLGKGSDLVFLDSKRLATCDGNDVVLWSLDD